MGLPSSTRDSATTASRGMCHAGLNHRSRRSTAILITTMDGARQYVEKIEGADKANCNTGTSLFACPHAARRAAANNSPGSGYTTLSQVTEERHRQRKDLKCLTKPRPRPFDSRASSWISYTKNRLACNRPRLKSSNTRRLPNANLRKPIGRRTPQVSRINAFSTGESCEQTTQYQS